MATLLEKFHLNPINNARIQYTLALRAVVICLPLHMGYMQFAHWCGSHLHYTTTKFAYLCFPGFVKKIIRVVPDPFSL